MNNTKFEIEKHEKNENNFMPKISLFDDQTIEKENDSLDYNECLNKDNIILDKFLEISTKANTNEGKLIEKKNKSKRII